jgi:AraC-like DNA-binding protein
MKGAQVMSTAAVCATLRFSTARLPEVMRAQAVRDLHLQERTILSGNLEPIEPLEPLPDCPLHVDLTKRTLPGLAVVSGTLSGLRHVVRPRGVGADDLLIGINVGGCSVARQSNHDLALGDGDAVFATRSGSGFSIIRPTAVRFIGCRVPRTAITPLVGRLDDAPIRLVPGRSEALTLLVAYAAAIADAMPLATSDLQRLAVTHMHDLIAATIGPSRDGRTIAEGRGIAAARLRAVMVDIRTNLCDGDLSVDKIARRHCVTPRYIYKLFEREGLTFSAFVLGQRLVRAYSILSDPRHADCSISSVAYGVGFGDLSYFNRTFRRRYAATPTDVRQSSRLPSPGTATDAPRALRLPSCPP